MSTIGQTLFAFFEDHLKAQKGLRPGSVRSYRDTLKLFLVYVATACRRPITLCFATILSALKIARFPAATAVPSRLSLHSLSPRISPVRAPAQYTCIY